MGSFTITEPHPTVPKGTYYHSGRGGAGNYHRAPATTPATGIPIQVTTSASTAGSTRRFYSGRGGAGNAHTAAEAPLMSFDEEYTRAQAREANGVGHVGRGGAGNFYSTSSQQTQPSSRRSSGESGESRPSGLWARISGHSLH